MKEAIRKALQESRPRLLVVGDVMLDEYWHGEVTRISPEAPVPIALIKSKDSRPGGAANVAANAAALGAHTVLLSVIGNDGAGATLASKLGALGVEARLHRDEDFFTTVKIRVVGHQQQLIRIDFEEKPTHEILRSKAEDYHAILPKCDLVIISDYGKGGLTHVTEMIQAARAVGKKVLVDPKGNDWSRYAGATTITPNRSELREVIGAWRDEYELERKTRDLISQLDLESILLTRSEEGMTYFDAHSTFHHPAQAQEVFDVSGAGDTAIAAFAMLVACGLNQRIAVQGANVAAGIVVKKFGTATLSVGELLKACPES